MTSFVNTLLSSRSPLFKMFDVIYLNPMGCLLYLSFAYTYLINCHYHVATEAIIPQTRFNTKDSSQRRHFNYEPTKENNQAKFRDQQPKNF